MATKGLPVCYWHCCLHKTLHYSCYVVLCSLRLPQDLLHIVENQVADAMVCFLADQLVWRRMRRLWAQPGATTSAKLLWDSKFRTEAMIPVCNHEPLRY